MREKPPDGFLEQHGELSIGACEARRWQPGGRAEV